MFLTRPVLNKIEKTSGCRTATATSFEDAKRTHCDEAMRMNRTVEKSRHVLLTPDKELVPLPTHAACPTPSISGECITFLPTHPLFSISSKSFGQFNPSEIG